MLNDAVNVGRAEAHHSADANDGNTRRLASGMIAHPAGRHTEQTGDFRRTNKRRSVGVSLDLLAWFLFHCQLASSLTKSQKKSHFGHVREKIFSF